MNRFDYQFPVRIHFGQGCFEDSLKNELQKYGKNVMLPTPASSLPAAADRCHATRYLRY